MLPPGPTPTEGGLPRRFGDFGTLADALDYAAGGATGLNFYNGKGELAVALPYRELRLRALSLARRLLRAGLVRGDRVAVVAETHPDVVAAFCACQYAGLVPALLPLPPAFGGKDAYVEHLGRLVGAAQASALFVPEPLVDWLAAFARDAGLKAFGTVAGLPEAPEDGAPPAPSRPEDVAYLQFSSGSTRFPTGVAVRQRALMSNVEGIMRHGIGLRPDDRAVSWLPLYHDMGLVGFLLASLAGQVSVDLLPPQDFARRPQVWLRLLSSNRGTLTYSPSFGYELCVRRGRAAAGPEPLDLSAWRVAGIGGDMIRPAVLSRFAEVFAPDGFRADAFVPSYGMAEATLAVSFAPLGAGLRTDTVDLDRLEREGVAATPDADSRRVRSFVLCGPPLPGTELEIGDAAGAPLPERRVGRILVRGPGLMRGYDGRPAETAAVLSPDGWLDTGDLGYRLGSEVVVTGRAKDLIIVNGRNVWPQDLEWSVEQSVAPLRSGDVAAFSVEDDDAEAVVLLVETRGAPDPRAREALAAAVAGTLRARHGLEGRVVLVPTGSLPHTSSGKLSRVLARARYLQGDFAPLAVAAQ
ncbi:MAG: AMP-binding enzyme, associated with serine palmitoyltransferase [uncultured Acetobacteraceae bacterium]|uniref:AMP-binding enzyme, associated with serine palmitoyltransferase n=1 Tax=uncultured Acetobacteraceae bacterium TaxID=169975 RepID=A0A6J4HX82_9PROT|nr:MAG: AMP-binding enzyme, associated with serine palmitoyltransferase [uncultured Acetobacteraceae bacterium]